MQVQDPTQPAPFSVDAFLGDIGNIAKGIVGMPGQIWNAAQQTGQEAQQRANAGVNPLVNAYLTTLAPASKVFAPVAQSYAESVNKMVGEPVKVSPQGLGLQTPSAQEAYQYIGTHPVTSLLNAAPVIGKGLEAAKAGRLPEIAPATEAEANIINPLKGVEDVTPKVQNMRNMSAPKNVSDVMANTAMKGYTIPAGLDVNPTEIGKWVVNDRPNLSLNQGFLSTVENIKQAVLKDASDKNILVPMDEAMTSANTKINSIPGITGKGTLLKYRQEMNSYFPAPETTASGPNLLTQETATSPILNASGKPFSTTVTKGGPLPGGIGGASPLDTYATIKNLETQGYKYIDSGTDAYGKISNQVDYKLGHVYLDTARKLESELDSKIGQSGSEIINQYTQSPAIVGEVRKFSPQVADRLQNNIQNWSDLRSLQAPYTQLQRVLDYTNRAGHTAFANLSGGASKSIAGGLGAGVGGMIAGTPGAITGGVVGSMLEPALSELGNKFLPPLATKISSSFPAISEGANAVKTSLPVIPQLNAVGSTPQGEPQNYANNGQGTPVHDTSISPGSSKYQTPDMPQGFLLAGDYNNQKNDLTQRIANASAAGNIVAAQRLKGELDQLDNTWSTQSGVRDAWTKSNYVSGTASSTYNIILKADPNLLNLNESLDKLFKSGTPQGAALKIAMQNLQQATGIDLSSVKTEGALLSALDTAMTNSINAYNTEIKAYSGGSLPNPAPGQFNQPLPQPINDKGLLPIQQPPSNFHFGVSGEGMPPMP